MSVQTAYAADKFNVEVIKRAIKSSNLEEKVKHREIIIPGYVAILKAGLEEDSGWEVIVGPKEANGIPKFLKTLVSQEITRSRHKKSNYSGMQGLI